MAFISQPFGAGSPFRRKYIGIIAGDRTSAANGMHALFGEKYSLLYAVSDTETGLQRQKKDYGLEPLACIQVHTREYAPDRPDVRLITPELFAEAIAAAEAVAAAETVGAQ